MKAHFISSKAVLLAMLCGILLLTGCGRLRDRRLSRLDTADPLQAFLSPSPDVSEGTNTYRASPTIVETDAAGTQSAVEISLTVSEINQLLESLETELIYEQIDLAEGSLDLEFLEIDALLQELESQESVISMLDNLP